LAASKTSPRLTQYRADRVVLMTALRRSPGTARPRNRWTRADWLIWFQAGEATPSATVRQADVRGVTAVLPSRPAHTATLVQQDHSLAGTYMGNGLCSSRLRTSTGYRRRLHVQLIRPTQAFEADLSGPGLLACRSIEDKLVARASGWELSSLRTPPCPSSGPDQRSLTRAGLPRRLGSLHDGVPDVGRGSSGTNAVTEYRRKSRMCTCSACAIGAQPDLDHGRRRAPGG